MNGLAGEPRRDRRRQGRHRRRPLRGRDLPAGDPDRRRGGSGRRFAALIGGQDCHGAASGAHTGDISAEMIADAGGRLVIVGHSERRTDHGETDAMVRAKAEAAWRAGLLAILCIGETAAERRADETLDVLDRQLWGFGPGWRHRRQYRHRLRAGLGDRNRPHPHLTMTSPQAHAHIRARLDGSVRAGSRGRSASCTEARSSRGMRRRYWPSPMSTARWSAAPASKRPIFSGSSPGRPEAGRHWQGQARSCTTRRFQDRLI